MTVQLAPALPLPGLTIGRRIDVNQIHVGAVIQLLRAELAHPDDHEFRLHPGAVRLSMHRRPMHRLKILIDDFVSPMNKNRGEIGQGAGRLFNRGQMKEIAHTNTQHFPATDPSQNIQFQFHRLQRAQALMKGRHHPLPGRRRRQHIFFRQPIHEHGVANEREGEGIAVAENRTEQPQHLRGGLQIL
jgi:hypothetical protein